MSYADRVFIENCKDIIENGFSDKDLEVRPRWLDGTPFDEGAFAIKGSFPW